MEPIYTTLAKPTTEAATALNPVPYEDISLEPILVSLDGSIKIKTESDLLEQDSDSETGTEYAKD